MLWLPTSERPGRVLRKLAMACLVIFPMACTARADSSVCEPPGDHSFIRGGYFDQEGAAVTDRTAAARQEHHEFDLQFQNDGWTIGASHRYVILDIEPLELQTNGHLHTLSMPLHWQRDSDGKGLRLSVAPALSTSSNMMKDTASDTRDGLQVLGAAVWYRDLSSRTTVRYGLCGDHRFGDYRIYPTIAIAWRPHDDWLLEPGFPTTRITYAAHADVDIVLRVAPAGNEWRVSSADRQRTSRLVYESVRVELTADWRAGSRFVVSVSVGRQFDNRYDVVLQDDSRTQLETDDATRIGAALTWRFN